MCKSSAWSMCESKWRALTHVSVFTCVCVCVIVERSPSDVPSDLWPLSWGQTLTNEMVELWPELQTFHNNLLSSSSPVLISVISHSSRSFSFTVKGAECVLVAFAIKKVLHFSNIHFSCEDQRFFGLVSPTAICIAYWRKWNKRVWTENNNNNKKTC